MSRIVTSMICDHCGHEWQGYTSFGHPEKTIKHKWSCEKCGAENVYIVEEWIKSSGAQDNVRVYNNDTINILRIFRTDSEAIRCFSQKEFKWKAMSKGDGMFEWADGALTLKDISDQIKRQNGTDYIGVIYVWIETPLCGAIYQYGNYDDNAWRLYCKTPGYA